MARRKLPNGMVSRPGRSGYYADFSINGRRIQRKLAEDFEAAKSILFELRARLERAKFDLLDNELEIAELRTRWLEHNEQTLRESSCLRYRQNLDRIVPSLAVTKVSQITTVGVIDFRRKRLLENRSPRTINMDVGALSTMLSWGVAHRLIGSNPIAQLKPLPHDIPKQGRPLSHSEVEFVLAAASPHYHAIWYALFHTGMRCEELVNLVFTDIDWDQRELIVRSGNAKSRRTRRIPIADGLWPILQHQKKTSQLRRPGSRGGTKSTKGIAKRFSRDHVFVTNANSRLSSRNLYREFMATCDRAGIETKTFDSKGRLVEHVDLHSTRRTFATELILSGADPKTVQELLGHRALDMTMRIYAQIKGDAKHNAISRLKFDKSGENSDENSASDADAS